MRLSAGATRAPHSWSAEERKLMRVLKANYEVSWKQMSSIVDLCFQPSRGIRPEVLAIQYNQLMRRPWRLREEDLKASFPAHASEEENLKARAEAAAKALAIRLAKIQPEGCEEQSLSPPTPTPLPISASDSFTSERQNEASHHSASDLVTPYTPSSSSSRLSNYALITPPESRDIGRLPSLNDLNPPPAFYNGGDQSPSAARHKRLKVSQKAQVASIPRILYRAYSSRSHGYNAPTGFRAGSFVLDARIPLCLPFRDLQAEATRHVEGDKRPTPLISLSSNLIRILIIATRMSKMKTGGEKDAFVTVIDTRKIIDKGGSIFEAKSLDLHPNVKYYSQGEYLVFGQIRHDAIVSHVEIKQFLRNVPTTPNDPDPLSFGIIEQTWRSAYFYTNQSRQGRLMLSYYAGVAVGQLLVTLDIPNHLVNVLIQSIITSWNFHVRKSESWRKNEIFISGLEYGWGGHQSESIDGEEKEIIDLTSNEDEEDAFLQELEIAATYMNLEDDSQEELVKVEETDIVGQQDSDLLEERAASLEDGAGFDEHPLWTGM